MEGSSRQVTGIVADAIHGLSVRIDPVIYLPFRQAPRRDAYVTLSSPGADTAVVRGDPDDPPDLVAVHAGGIVDGGAGGRRALGGGRGGGAGAGAARRERRSDRGAAVRIALPSREMEPAFDVKVP